MEKLFAGVVGSDGLGFGLKISGFLNTFGVLIGGISAFGGIVFFIFGALALGGIALNFELNSFWAYPLKDILMVIIKNKILFITF
jgi:hypothetical protein